MRIQLTAITLLTLLSGCEKEYIIKNNQVYMKGWNEGSGNYELLVEGADASTFQTVETDDNTTIGKDKNNVYVETTLIQNFDPKTLRYLGSYYYIDSDSAYFFGSYNNLNDCEIIGADPKTLKVLDEYPWARDNKHIVYRHNISSINDNIDFEVLSENWARTRSEYFYQGKSVQGIDIETFEIINDNTAKDKLRTYEYSGF